MCAGRVAGEAVVADLGVPSFYQSGGNSKQEKPRLCTFKFDLKQGMCRIQRTSLSTPLYYMLLALQFCAVYVIEVPGVIMTYRSTKHPSVRNYMVRYCKH